MARTNIPTDGDREPESHGGASSDQLPPAIEDNSSTNRAMLAPLYPPKGNSAPARAASASLVGRPSRSTAHPSGRASPRAAASRTETNAVLLDAWSTVSGRPPARGTEYAIGLVPNTRPVPGPAASSAGETAVANATSPASTSRSVNQPSCPQVNARCWAKAARPQRRA